MDAMAQPLRTPDPDARSYVERVRELVEQERVPAARKLLAEAEERGLIDEDLASWQRVLAPAKVLRVGGKLDIDRTPDIRWLEEHGLEYPGEWVAILQGELLAHSAVLDEVLDTVEAKKPSHPAILEYIKPPRAIPGLAEARTYSEKIRILIEADRVGAARLLLEEALRKGDHGEDLSLLEQVLGPVKLPRRFSGS
jgi:hypothetical protein